MNKVKIKNKNNILRVYMNFVIWYNPCNKNNKKDRVKSVIIIMLMF